MQLADEIVHNRAIHLDGLREKNMLMDRVNEFFKCIFIRYKQGL